MSQDWNTDVYDKDARSADAIMQDVEKMFDTLKSASSGTAAPSNIVAGMLWYDTTNDVLKVRNAANTAWLEVNIMVGGSRLDTDEVRALTSAGLSLKNDAGGLGVHVEDGGKVKLLYGTSINEFSTDGTLVGDSDDAAPTEKAVKTKIDGLPLMLPFYGDVLFVSAISTVGWASVGSGRIYVPSAGQRTLRMACRIKIHTNGYGAYCRFKVDTLESSYVTHNTTVYTWYETITLDVSTLPGWRTIEIQLNTSNNTVYAYLSGYSFIWE